MGSSSGEGRVYAQISHAQRLKVLYLKLVHQLPLNDIASLAGIKYHTVRNILRVYKKSGRTNKQAYTITRRDRLTAIASRTKGLHDNDSSTDHDTHSRAKQGDRKLLSFLGEDALSTQVKQGDPESGDFDDGKRCGLCLFAQDPTSPQPGTAPAQGQELRRPSGFPASKEQGEHSAYIVQRSSLNNEPSIQQEMVSSDVLNFQTSKDSSTNFFCGALSFLNDCLAHGEGDDLQLIKMSARRRAAFRAKMEPHHQGPE